MEPVFQAPDFRAIADYPVQCKNRFMEATSAAKAAPYHKDKRVHWAKAEQALDDYNTWLAVYGDQ